jgi:hypothetical protein
MTDKPWENEPDQIMFMSNAGYVCEIKRHAHFGHLCGYIYIPMGHPDFGKTYQALHGYEDGGMYEDAPDVHGGWTYSDTRGDDDGGKYTVFGFDCNHADDYAPKHDALLKDLDIAKDLYDPRDYKTVEFVTAELEQAAHQFKQRSLRKEKP